MKYPDYVERTEKINIPADTAHADNIAYDNALALGTKFANDYLSDPTTNATTVRLLSLKSLQGEVSFDASQAVVQRTQLDHFILALFSKS